MGSPQHSTVWAETASMVMLSDEVCADGKVICHGTTEAGPHAATVVDRYIIRAALNGCDESQDDRMTEDGGRNHENREDAVITY